MSAFDRPKDDLFEIRLKNLLVLIGEIRRDDAVDHEFEQLQTGIVAVRRLTDFIDARQEKVE